MAVIQRYPGRTNETENQLEDNLDLTDVLIRILDTRLPVSSRNPVIGQLTKKKPHTIILNKSGLADPVRTRKWARYFQGEGNFVISVDAQYSTNMTSLLKITELAGKKKTEKLIAKGASNPMIHVTIAGIPNCGESTIINRVAKRNAAVVGDKPGITRGQSWLKTRTNIQILDTPGTLWPKFPGQEVGYKLTACGVVKTDVFHPNDAVPFVTESLKQNYQRDPARFAQVTNEEPESMPNPDLLLVMTNKHGTWNGYDRFSLFIPQRSHKGKLGRITSNLRQPLLK